MIREQADIAIIGSGFAGSLTALIAEAMGLRPILIDRAVHPRFAIGESSTPIADMVLKDLCVKYQLPEIEPLSMWGTWQKAFPEVMGGVKRGFSYFKHESGKAFDPLPDHANELLVAANRDEYHADTQWLRSDVDAHFAAQVRSRGIPLFENTLITGISRAEQWTLTGHRGEEPVEIEASFLIGGTGADDVLSHALGITDLGHMMLTHSRAVFSHFALTKRWQDVANARGARVADYPFPADWAALHHVLDGAWLWILRFKNDTVSAGFMLDARQYPFNPDLSPEAEWESWMGKYPSIADQFASSKLMEIPGRIIRSKVLQRRLERAAGPGWALLPYAAGFVDPLHSTGIAHSLCGIEQLMQRIEQHWGKSNLDEELERYSHHVLQELDLIDKLVFLCYQSISNFRLWIASSMFYFAAATSYEHFRNDMRNRRGGEATESFLLAEDPAFNKIVDEALDHLARLSDHEPTSEEISDYERFTERSLEPYNKVGLFHPRIPNMYEYTAAAK